MVGVSKAGCVKLARWNNQEMLRSKRIGWWAGVTHHRMLRDSWMEDARSK